MKVSNSGEIPVELIIYFQPIVDAGRVFYQILVRLLAHRFAHPVVPFRNQKGVFVAVVLVAVIPARSGIGYQPTVEAGFDDYDFIFGAVDELDT